MLQIKTTGVEDYLDGSANIKALIIGGPGAGKTRSSSYWPSPIYLDCENSRGSLVDRRMPYAEIKNSRDMLDALEHLKQLERMPKAQRQFQTVVVDTVDSYARLVKDEWLQMSGAATFQGYDAWGYLDTKMQILLTRLLNLDYNVLVLAHYKDKTSDDGPRVFSLQLQGAISDQIFNDFGLVGWLGTYWEAEEGERVQKRGLTFQTTPDKPFLKDRFNVTPKWLPITFTENDYNQLFEAFFNRPEFEAFPEKTVIGEIPPADGLAPGGPVAPPQEGGALPPTAPAEVPLEKKTKAELEEIAKGLGIAFKGNTLKGELVAAIKAKQESLLGAVAEGIALAEDWVDAAPAEEVKEKFEALQPEPTRGPESEARDAAADRVSLSRVSPEDAAYAKAHAGVLPDPPPPTPSPDVKRLGDMTDEELDAAWAADKAADLLTKTLGAEVISTIPADAPVAQKVTPPPTPVEKPSAPRGPSACADCGKDLGEEWNDPNKRDYIRLSFVKHRKYLCTGCLHAAS